MKEILFFPKIHSIVDFISSSSTELFITDINQEVETIKTFLDDISEVIGEPHGVGEIYTIDESNLRDIVKTLIPYNDYGPLKLYIKSYEEFENEFFRKHKKIFWNKSFTEKEKEKYRKQRNNLWDSYEDYKNSWIVENFEKLKEMFIGRIIIEGEGDNSIPCKIFDILESKFNCKRFHLG